jgi:glycosyltransferase involved in cell wall biosynthesis
VRELAVRPTNWTSQLETLDKNAILVSIIIPAFNVERWIEQCIESVLVQSYRNLEVIVIDDGSSDRTWSVIESFASSDPRIRSIRQENHGLSAVRNRGVRESNGSILFFLDSDDWIHAETIADAVKLFRDLKPDVVMIRCTKYFDDRGVWSSGTDDYYWRMWATSQSQIVRPSEIPELMAFYPLAQLKILSKSFFVKNGLSFVEGLKYEDNPFHVALFCLNPRFALIPQRYYAWRQGRSGQITAKPYVSDCLTAVRMMLESADRMESNAFTYLIVAVARLIGSVAHCIVADSERREFIATSIQTISESIDFKRLEKVLEGIPSAPSIHPGDRVLVKALFTSPNHLATALGPGFGRYWSTMRMLLSVARSRNLSTSFRDFVVLAANSRMLINYSRGVGECRVCGLG